jgi:hypothetical protein
MSNVQKDHILNDENTVHLSHMDKSSCNGQQRQLTTCIYYPEPYATTNLEIQENCQYATVKR